MYEIIIREIGKEREDSGLKLRLEPFDDTTEISIIDEEEKEAKISIWSEDLINAVNALDIQIKDLDIE